MKDTTETLRLYGKRRKIGTWLVIGSFALFIAACIAVGDFQKPYGWTIWSAFGLFIACSAAFLTLTRCPFCGKTIVVGSMSRSNCPHCGKRLTEPRPNSRDAAALSRRSGK